MIKKNATIIFLNCLFSYFYCFGMSDNSIKVAEKISRIVEQIKSKSNDQSFIKILDISISFIKSGKLERLIDVIKYFETLQKLEQNIKIVEQLGIAKKYVCEMVKYRQEFLQILDCGVAQNQGARNYMEDFYDVQLNDNFGYFAIFDGHGGKKIAQQAKDFLYITILEELENENDISKALINSFLKFDIRLTEYFEQKIFNNQGSTAVVAYLGDEKIIVANIGDSRAVLSRNGKAMICSNDHKPDKDNEIERIYKSGNFIMRGRLNGDLAMSRTFGDFRYKQKNYTTKLSALIAEPEIMEFDLDVENEFLILASDGIWDVISNNDAVKFVKDELSKKKTTIEVANNLVNQALKRGSKDNLTALIVKLK